MKVPNETEILQWAKNQIVKKEFELAMLKHAWERQQYIRGLPDGEDLYGISIQTRKSFHVHFQVLMARMEQEIKMFAMIVSDFSKPTILGTGPSGEGPR